ncbi:MAG: alpha/beta hydrolase [Gammaproteobacteria bacterium]|nr:alpha/beta hydrolase [Gammaproteobacteria bacterium]
MTKPNRLVKVIIGFALYVVTAPLQANLIEQDVELATCHLHIHKTNATIDNHGPLFVMIEGVPLSALIYRKLALSLADNMSAQSILIDFPGVGKSFLKGESYTWSDHRQCIKSYLLTLPPHIVMTSDLSTPVVAPLMRQSVPIRGMIISNGVIKPSIAEPPFPMSFFRCCPQAALNASTWIPNAVLRNRIKEIGIGREATADHAEIDTLAKEMDVNGYTGLANIMPGFTLDAAADMEVSEALTTTLPLLYLWGTLDPVLGEHYKYLPALQANQQLVLYPQASHYPMLDHHREMARDIEIWYKKQFVIEMNAYNASEK